MTPYNPVIEEAMRRFYGTLSEKDKRRYAGLEALKLGHGGIQYIARLLGCHRNTITKAIQEVQGLSAAQDYEERVRKAGGGRKPYTQTHPQIDEQFQAVVRDYTAGDPMDAEIRWTNLSPQDIADHLAEK